MVLESEANMSQDSFLKVANDILKLAAEMEHTVNHGHGSHQTEQNEKAYDLLQEVTGVKWNDSAHAPDVEPAPAPSDRSIQNQRSIQASSDSAESGSYHDHGHEYPAGQQNKDAYEEWKQVTMAESPEKIFTQEAERYQNQSDNQTYYGKTNPHLHDEKTKVSSIYHNGLNRSASKLAKIAKFLEDRGL